MRLVVLFVALVLAACAPQPSGDSDDWVNVKDCRPWSSPDVSGYQRCVLNDGRACYSHPNDVRVRCKY